MEQTASAAAAGYVSVETVHGERVGVLELVSWERGGRENDDDDDRRVEEQPAQTATAAATTTTTTTTPPSSARPAAFPDKSHPSSPDFSSEAVTCLIGAVGRRWGVYETWERSQLFRSVQVEMATKGHVLPAGKIRRKWNNLIVTYKRVKGRCRAMGHAKTSWEFYDLMDATLGKTANVQTIQNNNKRTKTKSTKVSAVSVPSANIASKPQRVEPVTILRPHCDFANDLNPIQAIGSGTNVPEVKPFLLLNGEIVAGGIQQATICPSPSAVPLFTPSSTAPTSHATPGIITRCYLSLKTPPAVSDVLPSSRPSHHNPCPVSSSYLPASPSLFSSSPSSSSVLGGAEGPSRGEGEGADERRRMRRLAQRTHHNRAARRKARAREWRRERREVCMAESLVRIATALELHTSKQDTVIALLQRLADHKSYNV